MIERLKAALAAMEFPLSAHSWYAKACKEAAASIDLRSVIAEMEVVEPVAWMAESKIGNVRFTNIGQSADELESMGWKITPLAVVGAKPKAEPVAWVWNPAKEAWEQVHMFGNWQQGAIYAFGPTMPAQPKAEPAPTGWNNGLSQDYDAKLGKWFADQPGAKQQLQEDVANAEPVQEPKLPEFFSGVDVGKDGAVAISILMRCADDVPMLVYSETFAAPQAKPLTEQFIYNWWASENSMEDCEMSKLADFRKVVRYVEAAHGITASK